MNSIKSFSQKLLKSDNVVFTFIRSSISSQISSWTDMAVSFAMFAWVLGIPWLSTAIGAICGGIVNCIVGYKFTFRAEGVSKRAVVIKYALVWVGSLILNAGGTELLTRILDNWTWLESIGFNSDGSFAAARLIISLVVSLAWNFVLQRAFVFRPSKFDPYAIRICNVFSRPRKTND